jgi:uncharacterized lipoprotein NlpE involved in copper resistance
MAMPVRRLTSITVAALVSFALVGCDPIQTTNSNGKSSSKSSGKSTGNSSSTKSRATVKITASDKVCWVGKVGSVSKKGCGRATIKASDSKGTYRIQLRKTKGNGNLTVVLVVNGESVDGGKITASSGVISIAYANR